MCAMGSSAGFKGMNHSLDVKTVRILLNLNLPRMIRMVAVDLGIPGGGRLSFQPVPVRLGPVDLDCAGGQTVKALMTAVPMAFNQDLLALILIGARDDDIARYFPALNAGMAANQVNTPLRIAHFLAQLAHESGSFLYSEVIASNDLNALADKDDPNAITKKINGGYNGLEDRKAKLARAKCFLIR